MKRVLTTMFRSRLPSSVPDRPDTPDTPDTPVTPVTPDTPDTPDMPATPLLRIRALVRKELRQLFRDPKTKRIVFVAPIIQLLMFGYAVNTDVHNVSTYLVDHDHTAESRALVDALTAPGYFRVVGRSDRPADLAAALDRGAAALGLQIPQGFARDLAAGRGANVQVLVDGTNSNTATVAQGYATRIVQEFALDYAARRGSRPDGGVDLRTRAWYNPDLQSRTYNVPAVIGALLLLMSLLLTALAVVRERELGTLEQLMVSPLTSTELILGKTIPVAFIALLDLVIISTVAVAWFGIPLRGSILALLLASSVYILAALGIGLFISTVSRTQQEAFMSMFLLFLPAIILSGFMYPVRTMPAFFQWLTLMNPVRHFLEIVRGIFLKGHGLSDLWPQFLTISVMAAAVLFAATRRFRRTIG
jgi:ABC-2 type transport system permease protein